MLQCFVDLPLYTFLYCPLNHGDCYTKFLSLNGLGQILSSRGRLLGGINLDLPPLPLTQRHPHPTPRKNLRLLLEAIYALKQKSRFRGLQLSRSEALGEGPATSEPTP